MSDTKILKVESLQHVVTADKERAKIGECRLRKICDRKKADHQKRLQSPHWRNLKLDYTQDGIETWIETLIHHKVPERD